MKAQLKPLDQQVIVITGASSGIGFTTAITAARQGAKVVLAARSENALNTIVRQIRDAKGEALAVVCDVADREQVDQVVEATLKQFGRIDTWVNNAGITIYGRLDEVSEEDNRRLFDTNFWGVVNGSLAVLPYLKQNGGALINVGSEVSEAAIPILGMYTASKHAVKGFTDCLRVEIEDVDQSPVSITLIQPTAVDTPFPQHGKNYMTSEPKLPSPMIEPQQVADAILSAAVTPTRNQKVGTMATINTFLAKWIPSLADQMAARLASKQQSNEPPRHPEGALFRPSETTDVVAQSHGTGERESS